MSDHENEFLNRDLVVDMCNKRVGELAERLAIYSRGDIRHIRVSDGADITKDITDSIEAEIRTYEDVIRLVNPPQIDARGDEDPYPPM